MISTRLVHQIEDHWEAISSRFLRQLRASHHLQHLSRIPESEITEICHRVLHNLGHWLVSSSEEEIARIYEKHGQERYLQGMPLSEAIRALKLLKEATENYIRDEFTAQSTVDVFAEEELEHQLGRFFDLMLYYLARGYEHARLR